MSSPFRSAMAAFEELPALTDDDLRVLLRSLGTDQLRRVMGIGHSALLQMDAHYATRIQLRDQALALAKQTMASPQGVAPPTAPLAPISKAKAAGRGIPKPAGEGARDYSHGGQGQGARGQAYAISSAARLLAFYDRRGGPGQHRSSASDADTSSSFDDAGNREGSGAHVQAGRAAARAAGSCRSRLCKGWCGHGRWRATVDDLFDLDTAPARDDDGPAEEAHAGATRRWRRTSSRRTSSSCRSRR